MSVIGVSAEDRFALLDMSSPDKLFAHPFELGALSFAAEQLGRQWDLIWDFRASDFLYTDIVDAYQEATLYEAMSPRTVLARPSDIAELKGIVPTGTPILPMESRRLPVHELNLAPFNDWDPAGIIDYAALIPPTASAYRDSAADLGLEVSEEELKVHIAALQEELNESDDWDLGKLADVVARERSALLDFYLKNIASNSLLSELLFLQEGERTRVIPYHSHSLHRVQAKDDEVVLMRPGRVSTKYWTTFSEDIAQLEALINEPGTTERELEVQLARNPLFLRGLNYQQVYTQVVLPDDRGPNKRIDVIVEPVGSEWTEIIELKRASEAVLVGRENRATLSAAIHSVVRQLREYRAYFDDRHLAKRVEARYGFRCHQPRLTAIVGRDPSGWKKEEITRALTTYPDIRIVTYDELLRAARSLLLL